jgi:hypothetical protein
MRSASEYLAQMRRHAVASFVGDAMREELFKFAFVQPDPVAARAPIIHDRMVAPCHGLRHLPPANRAPSAPLRRLAVRRSAAQERRPLLTIAKQKLELARIQPYTLALGAAVDLDLLVLSNDQRLFAHGAIHDFIASYGNSYNTLRAILESF